VELFRSSLRQFARIVPETVRAQSPTTKRFVAMICWSLNLRTFALHPIIQGKGNVSLGVRNDRRKAADLIGVPSCCCEEEQKSYQAMTNQFMMCLHARNCTGAQLFRSVAVILLVAVIRLLACSIFSG